MGAVRELFAVFGVDFDSKALKDGAQAVDEVAGKVKDFATGAMGVYRKQIADNVATTKEMTRELELLEASGAKDDASIAEINELRTELVKLKHSVEDDTEALKKLETEKAAATAKANAFSNSLKALRIPTLALATSVLGVVNRLHAFANEFAQQAETLRENARDLGATTNELQHLRFAADQAGIGARYMEGALGALQTQLLQVARYGGTGTYTTRMLGVSMRDSSGHVKTSGRLLGELGDALGNVTNPYRRARVAAQLFGEENARRLMPLVAQRGALRQYADDMERLGGGISEESVAASRQYTNQLGRARMAGDSLRSVLATGLLPVVGFLTGKLAELTGWFARMTRNTNIVQAGLIVLGVVGAAAGIALAIAWGPVVAPFLAAGAALALITLILDDLIGFMNGTDSATGRLLDHLFGLGTAANTVNILQESWQVLGEAVDWVLNKVIQFQTRMNIVGRAAAWLLGTSADELEAGQNHNNTPVTRQRGVQRGVAAPTSGYDSLTPAQARAAAGIGAVVQHATAPIPAVVRGAPAPVVRTVTHRPTYHISVAGVSNPAEQARLIQQEIDRHERDRRDAEHPSVPQGSGD